MHRERSSLRQPLVHRGQRGDACGPAQQDDSPGPIDRGGVLALGAEGGILPRARRRSRLALTVRSVVPFGVRPQQSVGKCGETTAVPCIAPRRPTVERGTRAGDRNGVVLRRARLSGEPWQPSSRGNGRPNKSPAGFNARCCRRSSFKSARLSTPRFIRIVTHDVDPSVEVVHLSRR